MAQALRGAILHMTIKSCGKAHAWCLKCKPDIALPKSGGASTHNIECQCPWCARRGAPVALVGNANPNWRGGPTNLNGLGWKAVRSVVWERDKACRACGLPPHSKRRLDVHHVVARRDGGTNGMENLVGLHHGCHMKVEAGKLEIQGL